MTTADILSHRLANQQLVSSHFRRPWEIVAWLGAMQAQEYAMARWAIGLRLPDVDDATVEKAFNDGKILRTHLLRPTWHFVAPADIRWLLALTAPRVNAINGTMYRKLELDAAVFKRSARAIAKALQGGKHLPRTALQAALQRAKIPSADGMRLGYLVMRAELDGLICSGPRAGRQFTYALLEERVPPTRPLTRQEALAELSQRYFASRGPATAHDFAAWSGLTIADAKAGIATLGPRFTHENIDGRNHVFPGNSSPHRVKRRATFLMPDYDEYGMGYKDRSALLSAGMQPSPSAPEQSPLAYNRMIVIAGRIEGTWGRTEKNDAVMIEAVPFGRLSAAGQRQLIAATNRYGMFLGKKPVLHIRT